MYSLRSIDVLSCGKVMGIFHACVGLLAIPLVLIAAVASAGSQQGLGALGIIGLIVLALFMPVFYGVLGFLFGALGAWLYNAIACRQGGIRIELKVTDGSVDPTKGIGLI